MSDAAPPRSILIRTLAFALAAALALGFLGGWLVGRATWQGPFPVRIAEGTTTAVNADGTAIGLKFDGEEGKGFTVGGADGADCLTPLKQGQHVRLGYLTADLPDKGASIEIVVWVRCLS